MAVLVSSPDIDSDDDITSWAAVTRASGFDAFAATPSSANLRALMTDESGSGALLFANGALGTPSSGVLTNATGLPISTGVAGLGTGVATALAVNVGSAGAPVINGGAGGTPSSLTLTNATGLSVGGMSLTAQYVLVGRSSSGAGVAQEITASADVFALLGSANKAAIRGSIDLGTAALVADNTLVHVSGTETIGGAKTFTSPTTTVATNSGAGQTITKYSNTATANAGHDVSRARGTEASPSAVLSGDSLYRVLVSGYNGTGFGGQASMDFQAAQDFTSGARGTNLVIQLTAQGASGRATLATFYGGLGQEIVGWFRPSTSNTRNLGETTHRWAGIYGGIGDFSGTVLVAAPTLGGHATNKTYVDGRVGAGVACTSAYGTNDAALTSAKSAAGAGGTVIIDNAVVLTSSATLDGYVTKFRGGTILAPASTATLTIGKIEAEPSVQIFATTNRDRVRATINTEYMRPEWFGAPANGTGDDEPAFSAAIAACQNASGIRLRMREYVWQNDPTIGDGTVTTRSTIHNGFFMHGDALGGVGNGDYGSPNILTSIKWDGATGASEKMFTVAGGIHSVSIRNIIFNCNAKAGTAGNLIHLTHSKIIDVFCVNWYTGGYAWDLGVRDNAAYASPYSAGVTEGFFRNTFHRFGTRTPPYAKAHAIRMHGGKNNNIGFSRNTFRECTFYRGNTSDSISLETNFTDNNKYDGVWLLGNGSPTYTGIALRRLTQSSGALADVIGGENQHYDPHYYGEIETLDDTTLLASRNGGWDIMFGHPNKDGGDLTLPWGVRAITPQGRMLSGWGGFGGAIAEPGHIKGCTLSNNATDSTNDIDIAAGTVIDATDAFMITCAAMTKRLDADWAAGDAAGMRNSAAAISNVSYHIYAVSTLDGHSQDYYATTDATAAAALSSLNAETGGSDYVWARRIGSIIREGGAIVQFTQRGDEFLRKGAPYQAVATNNPGTSAVLVAAGGPSGINVVAMMSITVVDVTADALTYCLITSPDQDDTTPSSGAFTMFLQNNVGVTAIADTVSIRTRTNTTHQVRYRLSQSTSDHYVLMQGHGWIDSRGRD